MFHTPCLAAVNEAIADCKTSSSVFDSAVFCRHALSFCPDARPFTSLSWYGYIMTQGAILTILIPRPDSSVFRLFIGLLYGILLTGFFVTTLEVEGAEESVYRCEDGSFTNRPDAGCLPYRAQGSVTVSPDGQPPEIIRDRLKSDTSTMTAVLPPPSGKLSKNGYTLCGLYDEWQALRRTTKGGTVFQRGRDVARWQALSKIFLSVGTPQCETPPVVRAAQAPR